MELFKSQIVNIHEERPYIKMWFNGMIDESFIKTWLESLDSVDHVNLHKDENFKYSAIIYPSVCWNIIEVKQDVDDCLTKLLQNQQ